MNRDQYRTARRSTRDNGHHYTASHTDAESRATLNRLHQIERSEDHLQARARWIHRADTTPANIIRLTTPTK